MTRIAPLGTSRRLAVALALLLTALTARPAPAATAEQVDDALERAKAYLYKKQLPNGTWDEVVTKPKPAAGVPAKPAADRQQAEGGQWTGTTALAVYALLAAGENPQDPRLTKAIEFLKKSETVGVYALGLRCQVWLLLDQTPEVKACMRRDATVLLNSIKSQGSAKGMYDYVPSGPGGSYSHSRAQYGVLGVWAAEQAAVMDIPDKYWALVEQAWIEHQDPSGGWSYLKMGDPNNQPLTPGMTAVGVATLFITQDYVHAAEGLACKGNITNPAIDKGLKWMADNMHLVATDTRYARDFPYVTLYAVERIGVAGGIKYFKDVDWYQKGADWLLGKQAKDGGWAGGGTPQIAGLGDTCFAMLFLARGRAPVAFNKLDYSRGTAGPQAAPWNQRPRDVANMSRWLGGNIERDLNWQIVPIGAPVADFLDAPILYVSGSKALDFTPEEKAKLRQYVEMGGLIVGNADCGAVAFTQSFQKLGQELFPAYEFRELPENHPMYEGPFPRKKWRLKPSILGLGNEVRELMLLVPTGDPARWWQSRTVLGKEEFYQLAGAILFYTQSNRDMRYRGDTHWVSASPKVTPSRSLKVYRLEYPGNWDPEPGGWRRMAAVVHNRSKLNLAVEPLKLGDGKLTAGPATQPTVAHLTGTAKFTLNENAKAELKKFVQSGGTLVVDAAGGATPFADSAEALLAELFGGAAGNVGEILAPDHPAYNPPGAKVEAVDYRNFVKGRVAGRLNVPRIRGIEQGGRVMVYYSREDLTAGLVGTPTDGILGYSPDAATDLLAAILVRTAPKDPTAATTRPTTKPATTKPATRPTTRTAKPKPATTAPAS